MINVLDMSNDRTKRFVLMTQMIGRLRIETRTSMRFSGRQSTLTVVNKLFGWNFRRRAQALEALIKLRDEEFPEFAGTDES